MTLPQLKNEIRDLNLSYLLLLQRAVRSDKAHALTSLGVSEPVADLLAGMEPHQLLRAASRNLVLCTLRVGGDDLVWGLLSDRHVPLGPAAERRQPLPMNRAAVAEAMA